MWNASRVAVILPTYNERDSIRACIEQFFALEFVDDVIVINNNAAAGTSAEVAKTKAREIQEPEQGYGAAIQRGFRETDADLVIVCEPDGTFDPNDTHKLLAYSRDFDMVVGTRTAREFIWQGANMGHFLKWGNVAVAKLMEALFNTVTMSDMGCTFRLIRRDALRRMQPLFSIKGSHFGPEMMLLACGLNIPFVQISINYRPRVGESAVTGSFWKAFKLGMTMIGMVLRYKWRFDGPRIRRRPAAWPRA